jgi:hypothetical protein
MPIALLILAIFTVLYMIVVYAAINQERKYSLIHERYMNAYRFIIPVIAILFISIIWSFLLIDWKNLFFNFV